MTGTNSHSASPKKRPPASEIAGLTMSAGLAALAEGSLTCERWTEACLERIEQRNADVKAWIHVAADAALARARNFDKHGRARELDGVPLGIKDTIDTADMPTERGDPEIFPNRRPGVDAPVVAQCRDLGMNILGKNTVSLHATVLPGPCRNPHDIERTPSASSAGSGASVADFQVPISLGTQTAGSIIRPSAYNGAVGFKPTLDVIPYVGIRTYGRPLDVVGPICRSVEDVTRFMNVYTGDPRFGTDIPDIASLRVSVWRTKDVASMEPESRAIFEENLEKLRSAGAQVSDITMPEIFDDIGDVQDLVGDYDIARHYADIKKYHSHRIDQRLIDQINTGEGYTSAQYAEALDTADRCRREFVRLADDFDVLVMPSTLGEAPLATSTGSNAFIRIWSLLHNPAINLPVSRSRSGLPIGLQVIGVVKEDPKLLYWARAIEQALGNTAHDL